MINTMVAKVLSMFLSDYFENPEKLTIRQLLTGTVTLHNLKIKSSVLSYLMLPMKLAYGVVRELEITIPWLSLATKPIMVEVKDVVLVYLLTQTNEWDANELNNNWQSYKDTETLKEKSINIFLDSNTLGSKLSAIMHRFLRNAIVSFHNIDLLLYNTFFGDTPFILGFKCMTAYNIKCNSDWSPLEKSFSSNTAYTTDYSNSCYPDSDQLLQENSSSIGSSVCYDQSSALKSDYSNLETDKKLEKLMENGILSYNLFIFENTTLYYREFTESDDVLFNEKTINEVQKWIRDSSDGNYVIYRRVSFQLRYRACNGPINDEILNILACDSILAPIIKTSFSDYSGYYTMNEQILRIRSMINSDRIPGDLSSATDKSDIGLIDNNKDDLKKKKWSLSRLFSRKKDTKTPDHLTVEEPPKYQTNLDVYQNIFKSIENKFLMRVRDSRVYPNSSFILIFPRMNIEISNDILKSFDSLYNYFHMYQRTCFIGLDKIDESKIPPSIEIDRYKREFRSMAYGLKFDYLYINSFYEKYSIKFIKKLNIVLLEDLSMQIFTLYENMSNWNNFKNKMLSNCYTVNSKFFKQKTPLSKKENDILSMYRNRFLIEIMPWYSFHAIVRDMNTSIHLENGMLEFLSDSILLGITSGTKTTSYDLSIENCLLRTDFNSTLLKNIIQSGPYIASEPILSDSNDTSTIDTVTNGVMSKKSKMMKSRSLASNIFTKKLIKDTGENEFLKYSGFLLSFDLGDMKPRLEIEAYGSWLITLSVEVIKQLVDFINYISQTYSYESYIQSSKFQPQVRYILGLGEIIKSSDLLYCDIPQPSLTATESRDLTLASNSSQVESESGLELSKPSNINAEQISFECEKISLVGINTVRSSIVLLLISNYSSCDMQSPFLFIDFGNIHSLASVDVSEEEDSCEKQLHGAEFHDISITMFPSIYKVLEDDDGRLDELLNIGNAIDVVRFKSREAHLSQKILPPISATLQIHKHSHIPHFSIDMVGSGSLIINISPDLINLINSFSENFNKILNVKNRFIVSNGSNNRCFYNSSFSWISILIIFWERTSQKDSTHAEIEFKNVIYSFKTIEKDDGFLNYIELIQYNLSCQGIIFKYGASFIEIPLDLILNYDFELFLSISDLNLTLSDDFDIINFIDLISKMQFTNQIDDLKYKPHIIPSSISIRRSTIGYQIENCLIDSHFDLNINIQTPKDVDWLSNFNLFLRSIYLIQDENKIQISQSWRCNFKAIHIDDGLDIDFDFEPMIFNLYGDLLSYKKSSNYSCNDSLFQSLASFLLNNKNLKLYLRMNNLQLKFQAMGKFYNFICESLYIDLDTAHYKCNLDSTLLSIPYCTPFGNITSLLYMQSEDLHFMLEPLSINGIISGRRKELSLDLTTSWANLNLRCINSIHPLNVNPVLVNSLGIPIYITSYGSNILTLIPNDSTFELSGFDSGFKIVILLLEHVFEIEISRVDFQVKELRFNFSKTLKISSSIPISIVTNPGPPIKFEISSTLSIRNNTDFKLALYTTPIVTDLCCFLNCQIASSLRTIRYDFNCEAMFTRVLELSPNTTKRIPLPWLLNRSVLSKALTIYGLGSPPQNWISSTDVEDIKFTLWDENIPFSQIDFVRFFDANAEKSQLIANPSSLRSIYRQQRREAHALHLSSKLLHLTGRNIFISSEIIYRKHYFIPHYNFEVVLSPPMKLRNLLPHLCCLRVSGDTAELNPSEECGFYNGSTGFLVEIKMPYYDEFVLYKSKVISVGDLRIFNSERTIEFFLYAQLRKNRILPPSIRCCIAVSAPILGMADYSADESLSRHVSVYAPHWIFNNQPIGLIVKSDYNRQTLRPGECHIFGLSFYEIMEFARESIKGKEDNVITFSKPCKLDSLKSFRQVYIPPTKTDSARWLSIISRPAPEPFQRSTLTIIESRFTVINRLAHPIYLVQCTPSMVYKPFKILPGGSVAFHPMETRDIKKVSFYFTLLEPSNYSAPFTFKNNNSKLLSVLAEATKNPYAYLNGLVPSIDCDLIGYNLILNREKQEDRGFNEYWKHLWSRRGQKLQLEFLHPNSPKLRILFNVSRFWRSRRAGKLVTRTKGLAIARGIESTTAAVKHADVILPGGVQFIHKDLEKHKRVKLFNLSKTIGDDQIKLRQSKLLSISGSIYSHLNITPSSVSLYLAELNFTSRLDLQFRQAYRRHGGPSPRSHGEYSHLNSQRTGAISRGSIQVGKNPRLKKIKALPYPKQPNCRTCLIDVVTRIEGKNSQIELSGADTCKYKIKNKSNHKIYFSEPLLDPLLLRPHSTLTFGWSSGLSEYQGKLRIMISSQSIDRPFTFTCYISKLKIHAILPCLLNRGGVSTRGFLIAATLLENRVRTLVFTTISAQRAIVHVNSENILSLRRGSVALDRLYSYLQNRSKKKVITSPSCLSLQLRVLGLGLSLVSPYSAIQNVQDLAIFCSVSPIQLTYCYTRIHCLRLLLGEVKVDAFNSPLIRQWRYSDYWRKRRSKLPGFIQPILKRSHEKLSHVEQQILDTTWERWDKSHFISYQKSMIRFYISGNLEKRPFFLNHLIIAAEPTDIIVNTQIFKEIQGLITTTKLSTLDTGFQTVQPKHLPIRVKNPKDSGLVYIEYFYITPFKAYVSVGSVSNNNNAKDLSRSGGASFINYFKSILEDVSESPLSFHPTFQTNIFTSAQRLLEDSGASYLRQLVRQAAKSIGAFNLIGNPIGLFRRLHFGFCEFISSLLRAFSIRIHEFPFHVLKGTVIFALVTICSILDSAALCLGSLHSLAEQLSFYSGNVALDVIPIPVNRRALFEPAGLVDTICNGIHGSLLVLLGSLIHPVSLLYWNFGRFFKRLRVYNKGRSTLGWRYGVDKRETSRIFFKLISFITLGPPMSVLLLAKSIIRGLSCTLSRLGKVTEVKAESMGRVAISDNSQSEYDFYICKATKLLNQALSPFLSHLSIITVYPTSDIDMIIITDIFLFQISEGKVIFVCEKDSIYRVSLACDSILVYFTSHLKFKLHVDVKKFMRQRHAELSDKSSKHLYRIQNRGRLDAKKMFETLAHFTIGMTKNENIITK